MPCSAAKRGESRPIYPDTSLPTTTPGLGNPPMYEKLAAIYDSLYRFKDYAAASRTLDDLIQRRVPRARSLLDVACGTGKCIEQLQSRYQLHGVDLSREMLDIARQRCPGVPFEQADMTDFHLGRTFDVVTCLFSSIGLVRTVDRLD